MEDGLRKVGNEQRVPDTAGADRVPPGVTAAQLKIVHTALKTLYDDLGHEEDLVKRVVSQVLAKLPGEHDMRAIDLDRELRGSS